MQLIYYFAGLNEIHKYLRFLYSKEVARNLVNERERERKRKRERENMREKAIEMKESTIIL